MDHFTILRFPKVFKYNAYLGKHTKLMIKKLIKKKHANDLAEDT